MTGVVVAAAILAAAMVGALWVSGQVVALAYAVVYVLAVAPGLPLGFVLFGRRHAAAWIAGALLGYGLIQLALWFVIEARLISMAGFAAIWLLLLAATTFYWRRSGDRPAIALPRYTRPDLRALLLTLVLVPALMAPPYANLGREDARGQRYYRAYFTADFLWHSALAFELTKFSLPPRNPYMAARAMNYYWTYFLLPSAAAELWSGGAGATPDVTTVQRFLKANAILSGLLMMGALFLVVRTGVAHAGPAAAAIVLATAAASAEGLYTLYEFARSGIPFNTLLDTNVDAITAWYFNGLRIDNVPRSLWYTPQHTTAVALGLVGWLIAVAGGARASLQAIGLAGVALALATAMNPLLGGCFALVYGVTIAVDATLVHRQWRMLLRHALAAAPVAAAVAWGAANKMTEGAGTALQIGFTAPTAAAALATIALGLGPVLGPALFGLRRAAEARLPVALGASGILLGLFLLYFVQISEASWVGFRAGQILLVSIPILLARTLALARPATSAALAIAIVAAGVPTTAIDTYNAQDISNHRPGPGFRWTLWTTPAQHRAFAWIRNHTAEHAVVQMEPMVRAREHWTLIPSFAGRRMATGLPISLLPHQQYTDTSAVVQTLYATDDAEEASALARRLRIDYLYVDGVDAAAYPAGTRKLDESRGLFELVFQSEDVRIYKVL